MKKTSNKNLSLALAAFLSLGGLIGLGSVFLGGARSVFATASAPTKGTGTTTDPYEIANADNLEWFRDAINSATSSSGRAICAKLTDDITLSGTWTPIGNSEDHDYTGIFNGDGHKISGLSIIATSERQGLFGTVGRATIKDLTVEGSVSSEEYSYIAGIAGYVSGAATFRNCVNKASVHLDSTNYNKRYVGGIVGNVNAGGVSFLNCINDGTITAPCFVGGIVGCNFRSGYSSLGNRYEGCVNNGSVTATITEQEQVGAGGIIGGASTCPGTEVTKCYNTGTVTGSRTGAGGIIGDADNMEGYIISDVYNKGIIELKNPRNGSSEKRVGGIVGRPYNGYENTIERAHNYGEIKNLDGGGKGAIVGDLSSDTHYTISNCYSLVGMGDADTGAAFLTADEFKDTSSFTDWTFDQNPWTLRAGDDHPILGIHKLTLEKQGGTGGLDGPIYNQCHVGFFTDEACAYSLPGVPIPDKADFVFDGYYTSSDGGTTLNDQIFDGTGDFAVNESFLTGSTTLYAKWKAIGRSVTITGGTGIKSVYVSDKTDGTDLKASGTVFPQGTKVYGYVELDKGYKHKDGWTLVSGTADTEGAKYRVTDEPTTVGSVDIELGTFNADLITYSISYDLDGGSVATANPTSYNVESDAITLTNPTKEHCEFAGWTGTDLSTPTMTVTIPTGSIGDRTYTANWTPKIAILEVTGTQCVYDGSAHTITGISFKNALTNEEIDCVVKFSADEGATYTLDDAPSFTAIGEHTIYFTATKDGYVTLTDTIAFTITKMPLDFTAPTAKLGLVYNGSVQELITAGSTNAGEMLYAVNTTGELPEESAFSAAIPTGKLVGTYVVFFMAKGDATHEAIAPSLENKVTVKIARVARTEAEDAVKKAADYLDTIKNDARFADIVSALEGLRNAVINDAITADNVTAADVSANAAKLLKGIEDAKVSVVEVLIDAIGDVSYDDGSKQRIDEARKAYDSLSEANKKNLDPQKHDALDLAEARYAELKTRHQIIVITTVSVSSAVLIGGLITLLVILKKRKAKKGI